MLWSFVPVAFLLSLTPGPGMALVVRNAAKRAVGSTRFARRVEQATGVVLIALAGRLALDSR